MLRMLTGLLIPGLREIREYRPFFGACLLALHIAGAGLLVIGAFNGATGLLALEGVLTLLIGGIILSVAMIGAALSESFETVAIGWHRFSLALTGLLLAALPGTVSAWTLLPQLTVLQATHADVPIARPGPVETGAVPGATTSSTTPLPAGTVNILLLGGDDGPGRWGMRTDSINLVSITPRTGKVLVIGIPRNLTRAPMPAGPLRKRFPEGFPGLINAINTWAAGHTREVTAALGPSDLPGVHLLSTSISELAGLPVHGFVLVNMQGFIEVVDALGGVDVYVPSNLPAPGNVPGGKHPLRNFTKGWHRMDGTDALGFARTRKADSDYRRMGRQRCLLASLAVQNSAGELLTKWPRLAAVLTDHVRTNLDSEQLEMLRRVAGSGTTEARSLALVPPLVRSGRDVAAIRSLVAQALSPAGATTGTTTPTRTPAEPQLGATPEEQAGVSSDPVTDLREECRTSR